MPFCVFTPHYFSQGTQIWCTVKLLYQKMYTEMQKSILKGNVTPCHQYTPRCKKAEWSSPHLYFLGSCTLPVIQGHVHFDGKWEPLSSKTHNTFFILFSFINCSHNICYKAICHLKFNFYFPGDCRCWLYSTSSAHMFWPKGGIPVKGWRAERCLSKRTLCLSVLFSNLLFCRITSLTSDQMSCSLEDKWGCCIEALKLSYEI